MSARWSAFVIWAAVAALAVFWGLKLGVRGSTVPPHAVVAAHEPASGGDWTRLFGAAAVVPVRAPQAAAPVAASADSRFKLVGVVAPQRASVSEGLALIAVDGGPARAYSAGQRIDQDLRVLRVAHRKVELGQPGQPPRVVLELAALPEAATGVPGSAAPMPAAPSPPPLAIGVAGPRPAMPAPVTPPGPPGPPGPSPAPTR